MFRPHKADILAIGHAPILQVNRRIYRALGRIGWKLEIAIPKHLPWNNDLRAEPDHPDDPPIHRLDPRGSHLRYWWFEGLEALLTDRNPRIVYIENGPESLMSWRVGRWCKQNNCKLVSNTNENDIISIRDALKQFNLNAAVRSARSQVWGHLARKRVHHVVAICEDGRQSMQMIGFERATSVIPLGFDSTLFFPDASRRESIRRTLGLRGPVVAYFGRLSRSKGVDLLVGALGRLVDRQWQLLIDDFEHDASMGWLDEAISRADIGGRIVKFSASHEAIPDYMRAADIVVIPSIVKEQYGRVVAEAMACGCTVIVSDIGALPELVGDTGVIVPAGDVDALSRAISHLLLDTERRTELSARAQVRAQERLSINRQATLLDCLFKDLAGRHVRSGAI